MSWLRATPSDSAALRASANSVGGTRNAKLLRLIDWFPPSLFSRFRALLASCYCPALQEQLLVKRGRSTTADLRVSRRAVAADKPLLCRYNARPEGSRLCTV